ncbi:hypothetical protein Psyaliredsea_01420 [Psychrobacter alimentarius]
MKPSNIQTTTNTQNPQVHTPTSDAFVKPTAIDETSSKSDKKSEALKTPAHRTASDARFEEDARDLHRILPASRKVYIEGSRPDIQVPMREISLDPTPIQGTDEANWEKTHHFMSMTPPAFIPTPMSILTSPVACQNCANTGLQSAAIPNSSAVYPAHTDKRAHAISVPPT